jgi:hypothetical protein
MNPKIKSLNDLTIALHEVNKKYRVEDFIEAYKKVVGDSSNNILEELKAEPSENPFQKIMNISGKITDEMIEKLIESTTDLTETYNYHEYLDECNSLRDSFLKDRKSYFSSKVVVNSKKKDNSSNISSLFELSGTADIILGDFLDKVLTKIYPNHLDLMYEDLNGEKIKTKIRHRPLAITKEHIEAPLIDRYHGINAYDSFLLRSFFDIKKGDWVYIPIRLIIKIDCDNDIIGMIEGV